MRRNVKLFLQKCTNPLNFSIFNLLFCFGRRLQIMKIKFAKISRSMLSLLLTIIMVAGLFTIAPFTASAATVTVSGVTWTYTLSGGTAEITYCSATSGSVTIPAASKFGGASYIIIGSEYNHPFRNKTGITSVTMNSDVIGMEEYAFNYCTGLTSVNLGGSGYFNTIPAHAFNGCTALKSVSGNAYITTIGHDAFYNCSSLQ